MLGEPTTKSKEFYQLIHVILIALNLIIFFPQYPSDFGWCNRQYGKYSGAAKSDCKTANGINKT